MASAGLETLQGMSRTAAVGGSNRLATSSHHAPSTARMLSFSNCLCSSAVLAAKSRRPQTVSSSEKHSRLSFRSTRCNATSSSSGSSDTATSAPVASESSSSTAASKATASSSTEPFLASAELPGNYVLYTDDPDEMEKALEKLRSENTQLRQKVEAKNQDLVESGAARKEERDPSRLRLGAVAPPPRFGEAAPVGVVLSEAAAKAAAEAAAAAAAAAAETESAEKGEAVAAVVEVAAATATEAKAAAAEEEGVASESSSDPSLRKAEIERESAKRAENADYKRKTEDPISIVFVSSEVAPYSKTGGLADVAGALPLALAARGHRVMVISPRYMNGVTDELYDAALDAQCRIKVFCFGGEQNIAFFHEYRDGVDFVFVDHPSYHRPGTPYGDSRGTFGDNQFRFALLCHAACEAPLQLPLGGFVYGQKCLFVANDWHAGLVPVLIASKYRKYGVYKDSRCILAIHNLSHQGVEPAYTFSNLGVPDDWYGALEWVFPEWARKHALDKGEAVNILKGAVVTSDRIVTVSQGYAWEVTTAEGGWGLDGLLRGRSFVLNGVTNGIDIVDWDPETDTHIPAQFSLADLEGKAACKAALQKELGLPVRADVPLIGFIGRLDWQKGPDIIQAGLPELMTDDVQFVMLGSGDTSVEAWMAWAEGAYRDKFRGWVGFSVPVAHRITAGCDILLMPSRFEPCGLNQLYAMRYGTVPVAHCTGGLRDTIEDFNPFANGGAGAGTGWTFSPLSKEAMMGALWTAISTYREHEDSWKGLMTRGMSQDMSWDRAALQYEQIFEWAMKDPPYA